MVTCPASRAPLTAIVARDRAGARVDHGEAAVAEVGGDDPAPVRARRDADRHRAGARPRPSRAKRRARRTPAPARPRGRRPRACARRGSARSPRAARRPRCRGACAPAARSITLTVPARDVGGEGAAPVGRDRDHVRALLAGRRSRVTASPRRVSTMVSDWLRSVVARIRPSASQTMPCGPSLGDRSMVRSFARRARRRKCRSMRPP